MPFIITYVNGKFERKRVMENYTDGGCLEQIRILMEQKRLYLIKGISSCDFARLLNIGESQLNRQLSEALGMDMRQLISMYRIQHARELLSIGVEYKKLWRLSGFSSHYSMNRALHNVVF